MEDGKEWKLTTVTAKLTSEEATLFVADGKGWNIIFDTEPTTVSKTIYTQPSFDFFHCDFRS